MTINSFIHPLGIAILGASADPAKLGYAVARNLIQGGYSGAIHLVNPRCGTLFGLPLHLSLAEVPDPVDLAVLIVPAPATPQALAEVAARGIRAAIITSGGFRETGAAGAALEAQCLAIAQKHSIRLLGPNCIGLLDTHLPLDTTFLPPPMPPCGDLAFLSHSGAFCAAIIDWSRQQGLGFSRLVSLGNQADVTETDLLPLIAADPNTRVIVLYLESLRDGARFVEIARQITPHKPIVALKVGRSASGQRAAASHTGALAGAEAAYDAAFHKSGVIRAETAEELFDWARALAAAPLPAGRNIAILTNAGGPGVIAADALDRHGLRLAELAPSTLAALAALLPAAASLHNPVDMLASATPVQYAMSLLYLLSDPGVDGALVVIPPPPMHPTETVADALIALIQASPKPVTIALMGSTLVETAFQRFTAARIPVYPFPERAASALGKLAERAEFLRTPTSPEVGVALQNREILHSQDADALLTAYAIPTAPIKLAKNETEVRELAAVLGFPLVLKIASADIPHKSDIGGVLLDINSADSAVAGFHLLLERARVARPSARIDGVHLQRQVPAGQEVIVGMVRDPQFGALMMFGSGGVEVEGLKDIAFALAPLNYAEAEEMLRKTWAGRKLDGFRSIPPADKESVIHVLIQLAQLAVEHPEIAEIEINPLRVLSQGAVAVDARLKNVEK